MTRFARAEGSKGSNKKEYEEATSWETMKADIKSAKKKKKQDKKKSNDSEVNYDGNQRRAVDKLGKRVVNFEDEHCDSPLDKKSKSASTNKNMINKDPLAVCNKGEYEEATSWEAMKADIASVEKNEKWDEKRKSNDLEVNYDDNQTREVGKLGKKFVNFDGEHSDDPLMKKSKNASADKNMVNKDPVSTSDELAKKDTTRAKKKKEKCLSLEKLKNNWIIEDGMKYKVFKDGSKKPWFDLAYEENEIMTRYNNFFVKREVVDELDQYKKLLEDQGFDSKEITKKMLHKERKFHNQLRVELLRNEIKEKTVPSETKLARKMRRKKIINNFSDIPNKMQPYNKQNKNEFKYEENDLMTQFEGYWILRTNVAHLQRVADWKFNRIIQERTDNNTDWNLTSEEEILYGRLMKKEKRREGKLLKTHLMENNNLIPRSNPYPRNNLGLRKGHQRNDYIAKFDGYFIRKDGAERLTKLRETMMANRCTDEEIESALKNERRREERSLKRENKIFCFKCRSSGHMVSACPESLEDGQNNAFDVCFRCGSAEHMARHCPVKGNAGSYPLATCFICNEVGHISRECPDNPKGLYPNGGCCKECGSVEHLKRDCPDLQKQKEENIMTLSWFSQGEEIEQMETDFPMESQPIYDKKSKTKIIKFCD